MRYLRSNRRAMAAAVTAVLLPAIVQAGPTNEELLQRIEELSQKVLVLERKLEVQDEATTTAATTAPVAKASPRGFSLASADNKNQLKLRGVVHLDGRFFESEDPEGLKDTWQATRVRPIVEGTLGGIYDFRITPDFGQGRAVMQSAATQGRVAAGTTAGRATMSPFWRPVHEVPCFPVPAGDHRRPFRLADRLHCPRRGDAAQRVVRPNA